MTEKLLSINLLKELVESAETNKAGNTASYIPELANVNQDLTALAVQQVGEQPISWTNAELNPVTLQSTSKLIPLIGLLEEVGAEQLFEWVKVEPSGDDFASITRLEQFGPKPSNPMLNAGAITLCSHIPGTGEHQFGWLEHWVKKLFKEKLSINPLVYASEKRTGDRNRSLAYLLKSRNNLGADVNETLDLYFALCSYEATLEQMLYLPLLLANGGTDPLTNECIFSKETCKITLAIMATCGLYDETGTHMVKTGIPAKSGVSGYIIGTVPGKAGIVALSPRVNAKGNSIRGELMLEGLSKAMNWHFALPG
ncbi:glutaminase [Legionella moravica]|uniref:Glutaminase n=1 Tax=Legionella moravica TaxID=39962 RepID=A0A378JTK7_9GAMM|nr:glutaminase A [Legionella moravica]KTD35399.1 glutaminase [Legionella moravica]STX61983.1 glutaminase [Legionella moravica]